MLTQRSCKPTETVNKEIQMSRITKNGKEVAYTDSRVVFVSFHIFFFNQRRNGFLEIRNFGLEFQLLDGLKKRRRMKEKMMDQQRLATTNLWDQLIVRDCFARFHNTDNTSFDLRINEQVGTT
jgi:hypothetical protein